MMSRKDRKQVRQSLRQSSIDSMSPLLPTLAHPNTVYNKKPSTVLRAPSGSDAVGYGGGGAYQTMYGMSTDGTEEEYPDVVSTNWSCYSLFLSC